MYETEWQNYMDGLWNAHEFMAHLMADGMSQADAEFEFASRWGSHCPYDATMRLVASSRSIRTGQ